MYRKHLECYIDFDLVITFVGVSSGKIKLRQDLLATLSFVAWLIIAETWNDVKFSTESIHRVSYYTGMKNPIRKWRSKEMKDVLEIFSG